MSECWYKDGLKFSCTGCGKCCTGEPGYVWISEKEIETMAEHLQIPIEEFIQLYTRNIGGKLSLKENTRTYDCVFFREKKCTIYKARPTQCRTFPYWPENLESKETWNECAKRCEGINHEDAPLISIDEIQKNLKLNEY